MRPTRVPLLVAVALFAASYTVSVAYRISQKSPRLDSSDYLDNIEELIQREKRQLENFDDEYPSASTQDAPEESGFWDKVVKVALKIFSRFIEWLNS